MTVRSVIASVTKEISTTSDGSFDPARVVGYGTLVLGVLVFFGLSIFDTVVNNKFNYEGFAFGFGGVATVIVAAAAGVWIKKGTEKPGEEIQLAKVTGEKKSESE